MKRISIDRATLEALYPPMDAAFEQQLRRQIDGLPTGRKRRMRKKTGLALVLAAALLLALAATAAAVYAATQDKRQMRKTVHKLAKGAEKTLVDLDRMVSHNWR